MSWFTRFSVAVRALIIVVVTVVILGVATFYWLVLGPGPMDFAGGTKIALADYHQADPTGAPPELAHGTLVQRGEYLARAADCVACHTARGGARFAGGFVFVLPFGKIYSANITPDKETGIGGWTDSAFLNAVRKGIDDQGGPLYPAMPFASYATMSDADVLAIKTYLFSLNPEHNNVPHNAVAFPFNQHWLINVWEYFFNADKRFEPRLERSAQWNRGAYLAESLGHCGDCHTPHNLAYALNNRRKFAGETEAGWRAYNITSDPNSGVGSWSATELAQYLSIGHSDGRGTAAGPMNEVVENSLKFLTPGDIAAMVTYLQTVPAIASPDLPPPNTRPAPVSPRLGVAAEYDPLGKVLFAGSCASCHDWTGASPLNRYATLTGARAVNDPTATNVAQIVLQGYVHAKPGGKVFMPSFGHAFSDAEVAAVANYVTARFGAEPSAMTAKDVSKLRLTN